MIYYFYYKYFLQTSTPAEAIKHSNRSIQHS